VKLAFRADVVYGPKLAERTKTKLNALFSQKEKPRKNA
jgi:hypothetical protein